MSSTEHNQRGAVTGQAPIIYVSVDRDGERTAAQARAHAAKLVLAAAVLERIIEPTSARSVFTAEVHREAALSQEAKALMISNVRRAQGGAAMTAVDDRPTITSTSSSAKPAPIVMRGWTMTHPEHPGVTFVSSSVSWTVVSVVVTSDLTVDEVMAAALTIGADLRIKKVMRRAVQHWARSEDYRRNPHVCPREWPAQGRTA